MRVFKSLVMAATLGLATPAAVLADGDPKPGLTDVITLDGIAESFVSVAISALRTHMEVEYEHVQTDLIRGTVSLSGVTLRPQLPHDRARQCEISLQRIGLDIGQPRLGMAASNISTNVIGAEANIACFPREVGLGLRAAGYNALVLDRMILEFDYAHGSGEIRVNGSAAINDMATLDFEAAGSVLPRLNEFGTPGDPAIRVRKAVAGLQDNGAWARLSSQIPENLRQPEVIESLGVEALTNALSNNGTRALTSTERLFIEDLMSHVADFVREPGEITVEAQLPADGIVLEPDVYEKPEELLQALAPDARVAPLAQSNLLDPALAARLNGELSDDERLQLSRALLTGEGLPRADALVPDLLASVVTGGSSQAAEAALLTARAQIGSDPNAAYRNALLAAAARLPGAISILDTLEDRLTTREVIEAQDNQADQLALEDAATALPDQSDIRAVRSLALAHFTGLGASRSYRLAYYYALLAEAAGDIGTRPLREDIEARFANRGDDVDALWAALRVETQNAALNDWISLNLAERFGRDG